MYAVIPYVEFGVLPGLLLQHVLRGLFLGDGVHEAARGREGGSSNVRCHRCSG